LYWYGRGDKEIHNGFGVSGAAMEVCICVEGEGDGHFGGFSPVMELQICA